MKRRSFFKSLSAFCALPLVGFKREDKPVSFVNELIRSTGTIDAESGWHMTGFETFSDDVAFYVEGMRNITYKVYIMPHLSDECRKLYKTIKWPDLDRPDVEVITGVLGQNGVIMKEWK